MKEYCKGCKHHHKAGHPKDSKHAPIYNDYCLRHSQHAPKAIGHCKLTGSREFKRGLS